MGLAECTAHVDPLERQAEFAQNALDGYFRDYQLHDLITGPIRHLVSRGQQAGVVRADVDATDFAVILPMLSSVSDRNVVAGIADPSRRYLSLILAGLRPDGAPLPGRAPTDSELRTALAEKRDKRDKHAPRPIP